jgi:GNAT superfamily N-acetyltransferase
VPADYFVRPMRSEDVPDVERLTADGFYELDLRTYPPSWPAPQRRSEDQSEAWRRRVDHMLRHDPAGCWVAESRSGLIGAAVALKRDLMWILATFAVDPAVQGRGVGKQLLDAALAYGTGCLRGMVASSVDPKAVRRYRLAGFTMHPSMQL